MFLLPKEIYDDQVKDWHKSKWLAGAEIVLPERFDRVLSENRQRSNDAWFRLKSERKAS